MAKTTSLLIRLAVVLGLAGTAGMTGTLHALTGHIVIAGHGPEQPIMQDLAQLMKSFTQEQRSASNGNRPSEPQKW